ncbi:hypothetical protein D0T84_20155 [Dysgonomonas sp. 521]|uniref:hypothetical protein n=1 Tax=Dysgonomonas sp. 521 TaxID=2302932 RepID=UPI0013D0A176|nr:hypothetical protein [Dysgonomonas sp. 521]NDV97197.1 hypothetical protein [Dysgonomonas sp. 521]
MTSIFLIIVGIINIFLIMGLLIKSKSSTISLVKNIESLEKQSFQQNTQISEIGKELTEYSDKIMKDFQSVINSFEKLNTTHQEMLKKENQKLSEYEHIFKRAEHLKEEYNNGYDTGYKKGQTDASKVQGWEVQIYPWKEDVEEGTIFKKQTVKIGYKYQLYVNGVPCFEPHIQIHDTLITTKMDADSVSIAVAGLKETMDALSNIHPAIKTIGDGTNLAKSLLNLTTKN